MFYETFLMFCENSGMTPSGAATQAGISRSTITKWKNKYDSGEDTTPTQQVLEKLCTYFQCSKSELMGEKKEGPAISRAFADEQLLSAYHKASPQEQAAIRVLLGIQ